MADEEIIDLPTVVTDDQPVEVRLDAGKKDPQAKGPSDSEREAADNLKDQVRKAREDSARRLSDAQRQIDEAHRRATEAETEVRTTRTDVIGRTIDNLTRDKESAKRDLQAAHEAGDFARIADSQDRLSMANAELVEARKAQIALKDETDNPRQQAQPVFVDDVEKLARQLSQKGGAWLRANPQFATGAANAEMMSAHWAAIGKGHAADSDGYYGHINKALGLTDDDHQPSPAPTPRRQSSTSAPVSRDVSSGPRKSNPGTVRLSREQVQAAQAMDMTNEEYALNMVALINEGKMTNSMN